MRFAAYLVLPSLFLCGCGQRPFTRAVGTYAQANQESTQSLAAAPAQLVKLCWKSANVEYLQSRLLRLKAESDGVKPPAGNDYYIPWEKWYTEGHPTTATATGPDGKPPTWTSYCSEVEATGKAFTLALGALKAYADASAPCPGAARSAGPTSAARSPTSGISRPRWARPPPSPRAPSRSWARRSGTLRPSSSPSAWRAISRPILARPTRA